MSNRMALGKRGEDIALQYLLKKGFKLLEKNWRFHHKEVDIIALDGQDLVFVEVKTRSNERYGSPEEAIDNRKQQYLIAAAEAYTLYRNPDVNIRFDIVSIILRADCYSIDHIEDAF
ncbi:MAG: YraN family protein [Bacteroidales bacterium]|nr:YraN family protein [Bacteroidales bacterium]